MGISLINASKYYHQFMHCLVIIESNLEMIWIILLTVMALLVKSCILIFEYYCIWKISIINGPIINGCLSLNIKDKAQSIISMVNPILLNSYAIMIYFYH